MNNIFSGIKIIDCTRVLSGPFASRYFADYGAEVIKIEHKSGDDTRYFDPIINYSSGYFETLNRGKKSITLDLKEKEDLEILYKLISESDIFLENFSPQVKYELKIDYETLHNINPQLIYGSLNGYGDNSNKKAYDAVIQAECGLASLNGSHEPMKNATAIIDTYSGTNLALAVTSLLYKREKNQKGSYVNIPMIASGIQLLENNIVYSSINKTNPPLVGNHDNAICPFGFFKTKDGNISLAIANDDMRKIFTKKITTELINQYKTNKERVENQTHIINTIEAVFQKYTSQEITKKLDSIGIPSGIIRTMEDVLSDEDLYQNNILKTIHHNKLGTCTIPYEYIKFKDYPLTSYVESPELGEHNKNFINTEGNHV